MITEVKVYDTAKSASFRNIEYPLFIGKTINGLHKEGTMTIYQPSSVTFNPPQAGYNELPYNKFTRVEITLDSDVEQMLIEEDIVTQDNLKGGFIHNIRLFDPVNILAGDYMPDLTFTQPINELIAEDKDYYNYLNAIERVLALTPLRTISDGSPKYQLDESIKSRLEAKDFPQTFPKTSNLLEFITEVGKRIAAVPIMSDWDTISFIFLQDLEQEEITIDDTKLVSKEDSRDNQYCTNIDTTLENVVAENDINQSSIFEPASNEWATYRPRNEETRLVDENRVFITQQPILQPIKFMLRLDQRVDGQPILSDYPNILEADLSDFLVPEEVYNGLEREDKQERLVYKQGDNIIDGFFYFRKIANILPTNIAINVIASKAITEQYTLTAADSFNLSVQLFENNIDIREAGTFRLQYIPQLETCRIQVDRQKDNDFIYPFSYAFNQYNNQVSSEAIGEFLTQNIERMGKHSIMMTFVFSSYSDIFELGNFIEINGDRFVLTSTASLIHGNDIECECVFSKDYAAISERVGLNAPPRTTEITTKGLVNRNDVYKEYCIVTKDEPEDNESYFKATPVMLNVVKPWFFDSIDAPTAITTAIVTTSSDISVGFQQDHRKVGLSCVSLATQSHFFFNFSFKDNYSAGAQLYEDGNDLLAKDVTYNREYGINGQLGTLGRFDYLKVDFARGFSPFLSDAERLKLPELNKEFSASVEIDKFIYKKDTSEIPALTYEIIMQSDEDIILGEMFTKGNPLVTNVKGDIIGIPYAVGGTNETIGNFSINATYQRGQTTAFEGFAFVCKIDDTTEIEPLDEDADWQDYWAKVAPMAEREQYNFGLGWISSSSYAQGFMKYKQAHYRLRPTRRFNYNIETKQFEQNDTGVFLMMSKDSRPVALKRKLNKTEQGRIIFDNFLFSSVDLEVNVPPFSTSTISFGDPAPELAPAYQSWAILDEKDRLIIGGNYKTLTPIAFNFKRYIY